MYRSHWNETEFEVSNILNMIKCFTNHLSRSKVIIVDSWYRYVFSYQCIYGFKCLSEHAQKEGTHHVAYSLIGCHVNHRIAHVPTSRFERTPPRKTKICNHVRL
jgi:hypothetical protein